ncbi:MAG: beta-glucosidase [Christensenellales bacterium]
MKAEELLKKMTLREKVSLLTGLDFWHLKGIARLGVPSLLLTDGPHGLRKQEGDSDHLGLGGSVPATCFPAACATACSFDRDLLSRMGEAIGDEARKEGVAVVLGPGANIKRSPLCGRNFEYFSEDPCLSGEMATGWIQGLQRRGVGSSLKHFAVNNQETRRMSIDVRVSMRALREIYLASFERAVKQGKPATVMCSYNRVNGVYASEHPWLLSQVLRREWGYRGAAITDWGACNDHTAGVAAGMDIEMPSLGPAHDRQLLAALRKGRISQDAVDAAAGRVLRLIMKYGAPSPKPRPFTMDEHHHLARRISRETMVLLKNDGGTLPLKGSQRVAFIGEFAQSPRFQGGGSSHIKAWRVLGALEAVRSVQAVSYARGFDSRGDAPDERLMGEAVSLARESEVCVLFLGLPEQHESEGSDRRHMDLPENQLRLVDAVCGVCGQVVVVLHTGAPLSLPFADKVQAILCAYLGGQAVGGATVDLLFGAVSPSGKLAETWPVHLEDNPSYLSFPGGPDSVRYDEDIFVGYRWYDKRRLAPRYPFGHGLSYTHFHYSGLTLDQDTLAPGGQLRVSVVIRNDGGMAGKEVVQLYVENPEDGVARPLRELRGFEKASLAPGEEKTLSFALGPRDFSYWEDRIGGFHAPGGAYRILIGASSADIRLAAPLTLLPPEPLPLKVSINTPIGDLLAIPKYAAVLKPLIDMAMGSLPQDGDEGGFMSPEALAQMLRDMPLRAVNLMSGGLVPPGLMASLVSELRKIR